MLPLIRRSGAAHRAFVSSFVAGILQMACVHTEPAPPLVQPQEATLARPPASTSAAIPLPEEGPCATDDDCDTTNILEKEHCTMCPTFPTPGTRESIAR